MADKNLFNQNYFDGRHFHLFPQQNYALSQPRFTSVAENSINNYETSASQELSVDRNIPKSFESEENSPSYQDDNNEDSLDEMLIEEVKQYSVLWDPKTRGYKDNNKKNAAWKEVAKKLASDGKFLSLKLYRSAFSLKTLTTSFI